MATNPLAAVTPHQNGVTALNRSIEYARLGEAD